MSLVSCCLAQDSLDPLEGLANNIPGVPGQDYPIFAFPPDTGLACEGKVGNTPRTSGGSAVQPDLSSLTRSRHSTHHCVCQIEGYYADPEADCQAFHICANDSTDGKIK